MPYIETHVAAFLEQVAAMAAAVPKMRDVPPDMARQMFVGMAQMMDRPAQSIARQEDLTIAGIACCLYQPQPNDVSAKPVLIYFHGGGFVIGDLATHNSLVSEIAHLLQMTVVAVDYRLAPEHQFPAAYDDCLAVAKAIADQPSAIHHPVSGLTLAGDSAGGNLAAAISLVMKDKVKAQLLLYPAVDFAASYPSGAEFATGFVLEDADMKWFEHCYVPADVARNDSRLSPIFGDLQGAPPAVIITCGLDPLRDQGKAYAAKLKAAGVAVHYDEVKGHPHGCFQFRAVMPLAQDALAEALRQLNKLLA